MQWRVRRFFCVNGHGLFFGNGVQGNAVLCPCHTPMEKSLAFIVHLAPSRHGDGEHEKVKGDEARS